MAFDLRDRFETTDGSRPDAKSLDDKIGKELPLVALTVLSGGDAFENPNAKPPPEGLAKAADFLEHNVTIARHDASTEHVDTVRSEIVRQLKSNPMLSARMRRAKPIDIDLVPAGVPMASLGYPAATSARAAGLFWDHPDWDRARIALRQDRLDEDRALVVHEMGHAIHYLGFTQTERELTYKVLRPTFGSRAAMDEVFAIYTEREMMAAAAGPAKGAFNESEKRAPGIYGVARRQWNENHLFTRFVRKLYFPHKPLAGHQTAQGGAAAWRKFSGG